MVDIDCDLPPDRPLSAIEPEAGASLRESYLKLEKKLFQQAIFQDILAFFRRFPGIFPALFSILTPKSLFSLLSMEDDANAFSAPSLHEIKSAGGDVFPPRKG